MAALSVSIKYCSTFAYFVSVAVMEVNKQVTVHLRSAVVARSSRISMYRRVIYFSGA